MSVLAGRPLEGQTVAVLGGSGRMGAAVAEEVIGLGAGRAPGRTRPGLAGTDGGIPGRARPYCGRRCFRRGRAAPGAVGSRLLGPHRRRGLRRARAGGINDTSPREAQAAFARFWTSYAALHLASGVLPAHGSVTLISGSSARTPARGAGVWTTLHGALEALARAASVDLAPIRVNVVSPGGIGIAPGRQLVPRLGQPSDIGVAVGSPAASVSAPLLIRSIRPLARPHKGSAPVSGRRQPHCQR